MIGEPSIWGLTPTHLHDRFWAARGVQVVRQGEPSEIVDGAELFLLTDARSLAVFSLVRLLDTLCWTKPELLFVRLSDRRERGYRERIVLNEDGQFVRFQRSYDGADSRLARVCLTRNQELARLWQGAPDVRSGWLLLRRQVRRGHRAYWSLAGNVYDRSSPDDLTQCTRHLVQHWHRPDATVRRAGRLDGSVWVDPSARVAETARFIGPVWVGAGRRVEPDTAIVGPSVLWDDPAARPALDALRWDEIEPTDVAARTIRPRPISTLGRGAKRAFDLAFALLALVFTLPLYPFVMAAIWLEDGRPFFFGHRRETVGGREFFCWKFRSMRKDAELIKKQLAALNQADGPQFYMEEDPRLTRVGRFLRATNLDELPQFVNVLLGHMSVVGPRPSPHGENQYCPAWREARLSVRPGITGLWQVKRTRRAGSDFQEWIKYDIEYVERASWGLDLLIIWQTIRQILAKGIPS